ncbi:MAG: preprotein translocase subunit SecE [Actinobacteria bacterium]|nr:preprotein translocase subunit SecE [Actinomycetota bacterium]
MNRETKRMMQRQGQVESDGSPSTRRAQTVAAQRRTPKARTGIRQFFREVREEMRQVAWPTRSELINYTTIVVTVLVIMTALIFGLNFVFGKVVLFLFKK